MRSFGWSKPKDVRTRRPISRKTRQLALVAGFVGLLLIVTFVGVASLLSRFKNVDHVTWNDLVEDYDGDYSKEGFTNGTFASYDSVLAERLPSLIVVKDRIANIAVSSTDSSHCGFPGPRPSGCGGPYTSLKLASTSPAPPRGSGRSADLAIAGDIVSSTMLRFREGGEIVIRLQVVDFWIQDGVDLFWPVESFAELNLMTGTLAPSAVSPPESATNYVHHPPSHPASGPRAPISHGLVRPIAHDALDGGVTIMRIDHPTDRYLIDLGTVESGLPKTFKGALGVVNEEETGLMFAGGNVTGDIQYHLRLLLHNRTDHDARADGGAPIWESGPTSSNAQWRISPGDRDPRQAHGVATPVNSITGVRWIPSDDDATATDTVWVQVEVHSPPGTLTGRYSGQVNLIFKLASGLMDTQYVRISFMAQLEVL